jgi:hypothetical protein
VYAVKLPSILVFFFILNSNISNMGKIIIKFFLNSIIFGSIFFIQKGFLVFQIFIKFKKHFFEVFLCKFSEQEEKLK